MIQHLILKFDFCFRLRFLITLIFSELNPKYVFLFNLLALSYSLLLADQTIMALLLLIQVNLDH